MRSTQYPFIKRNFVNNTAVFIKFFLFFFLTIFLIIIKFIFEILFPKYSIHIPCFFHKILLWLINVKVKIEGDIYKNNKGIMYVSNHLSYLDIPVLGSLLSAKFVAKNEVAKWFKTEQSLFTPRTVDLISRGLHSYYYTPRSCP